MNMKTKYDIDQKVWLMWENKPQSGTITGIHAKASQVSSKAVTVEYAVAYLPKVTETRVAEYSLFSTKEELIASL